MDMTVTVYIPRAAAGRESDLARLPYAVTPLAGFVSSRRNDVSEPDPEKTLNSRITAR